MNTRAPCRMTLVASAALLAFAAHAQTTELQRVEVTGTAQRNYAPADASSATRTSTPVKDPPATVQVVDKSLIADKAITSPRELADVVVGVQTVVGYGNTASQWSSRWP